MKILLVDDEKQLCNALEKFLIELDIEIIDKANNGIDALSLMNNNTYDLVISDIKMPVMNGIELVKNIKKMNKSVHVILISGQSEVIESINALELGVYDFLIKPIDTDKLTRIIQTIKLQKYKIAPGNNKIDIFDDYNDLSGIIIASPQMQLISKKIEKLRDFPEIPILIEGKTGVGKEVIAQMLHYDKNTPFIGINCSALPKDIFESELFGYEKGAFTGGDPKGKDGKISASSGGILFLDEITEIPLDTQAKLLRVIQEKEYYKVGGTQKHTIKSRIICATNRYIPLLIKKGLFREDLYYRLNVCKLTIPPLKNRPWDIAPLVLKFMQEFNETSPSEITSISPDALLLLQNYSWPGNIRELKNTIIKAMLFNEKNILEPSDFKFLQKSAKQRFLTLTDETEIHIDSPINLNALNKKIIDATLKKFKGNKTKTAEFLGLNRIQMYYRYKNCTED